MVRGAPSDKTPVTRPTRTTVESACVVPLSEPALPVRITLRTFPGMLKLEKVVLVNRVLEIGLRDVTAPRM